MSGLSWGYAGRTLDLGGRCDGDIELYIAAADLGNFHAVPAGSQRTGTATREAA